MSKHKGKDRQPVLVDELGIFKDEGDFIVVDSQWSCSVGFVEADRELRIPKDHLAKRFRWRCIQTFSDEYWQAGDEDHVDCLWRLQQEMMKQFKKEMKAYLVLENDGDTRRMREEKLWYKMISLYISYQLYTAFYREFDRIESIFDNNPKLAENRTGSFMFWKGVLTEPDEVKSTSGIYPERRGNGNFNPQDDDEEEED